MSQLDPLTGLPDREAFIEKLELEVERFRRYNRTFGLAILAIDRLGEITSSGDSNARDAIIKGVADVIKSNVRFNDIVGRYDDDQFALILPEQTRDDTALAMKRICDVIEAKPIELPGGDGAARVTLHYGVATFQTEDAIEQARLTTIAEDALKSEQ